MNIRDNREKQRAYYLTNNTTLLNGEWDFKFYHTDFEEAYIQKDWDKIDVSSCWQARGYENPNYANVAYPYPYDPLYVPTKSPMGVYRKQFNIENLENITYIVFEGVSSCLELFINDKVGYFQGSHLQAEFVCDLLDNLDGIHTAIETSGFADEETYKRVISKFDYIMQDIKLVDEDEHIKYTGVSNKMILKNIEWLKKVEKSLYSGCL